MNLLDKFIDAIKEIEGWFPISKKYPIGSRSFRNRNIGNIRFVGQRLAIGKDKDGFAVFKTEEDGRKTLETMIYNAAIGKSRVYKPTDTILQFAQKYAPSFDGNHPKSYATFLAKRTGITINTPISKLIV